MRLELFEHKKELLYSLIKISEEEDINEEFNRYRAIKPRLFPNKKNKCIPCYKIHVSECAVHLEADYYVGLDWLIEDKKFVQVLPKLNTKIISAFEANIDKSEQELPLFNSESEDIDVNDGTLKELNYLKMFLHAMTHAEIANHIDGLIFIDWKSKGIKIKQKEDILTPFLVVQFLSLVKQIVRKGLKKSYYKVQENLNNRVKGKLLTSNHIKVNVLKNRLTRTFCERQEFGVDNLENRFLKKVLRFVRQYVVKNAKVFDNSKLAINQLINYCCPAFEQVSDKIDEYDLRHIKTNPFFREYKEAIKVGQYILKRFAYNITNTSNENVLTPPFWIDMPKLFELYVFHHLLNIFDVKDVKYHYSTYGNELDFLITKNEQKMVIDAKYKLHYKLNNVHQDMRQVAGYARLSKVYYDLGLNDSNELIDCLIIYPIVSELNDNYLLDVSLNSGNLIKAYKGIYKIGIPMPWIG